MKIRFALLTAVLLALSPAARAQTPDDYIRQGRSFLAVSNLVAANSCFSNAVNLAPDHPAGNVFYAATRLLVWPSEPAGSNFLSRLGFPADGRNLYHWTAKLPTDTNGVPLAPAGVNANEATWILRTNVLAALQAAQANLARVTDTAFTLELTSNETRSVTVTLDYGDLQMFRAFLHAAEYGCYTTHSWNLDAQLAFLHSLYENGLLSFERLLVQYPHLFTFATTNDLNAARLAFQSGVDRYAVASEILRNRTNDVRLFNLDPDQAHQEQQFRQALLDLTNSLQGGVTLTANTNYTVFLASHFSGQTPPRNFLPAIRDNGFGLKTLPDPTFGGAIYGLSTETVEEFLAGLLDPIPTIAPGLRASGATFEFPVNVVPGNGYVVQVSTNLLDWQDYTAFMPLSNSWSFADSEANATPRRFYRIEDRTQHMPPPLNDHFTNAIPLTGLGLVAVGYLASATMEPEEPEAYGPSVWWSWTAPVSGQVVITPVGGTIQPGLDIFTGSELNSLQRVGSNWSPFEAVAGTTYRIRASGGLSAGGIRFVITALPQLQVISPAEDALLTGPADVLISASATDSDGFIRQMWADVDGRPLVQTTNSSLSFVWTNAPLGTHYLRIYAADNLGIGQEKEIVITLRPPNDDFAGRIPLTGAPVTATGCNIGASHESGEPDHAGVSGYGSIWWSWTAPQDGLVTIAGGLPPGRRLTMSAIPVLAVYTGTALASLVKVAGNVPNYYGGPAQVTFQAAAGVTYQIAVDADYYLYNDQGAADIFLQIAPTQPPVVSLASPTNGAVVLGPTNLVMTAQAADPDGSVSEVTFCLADSSGYGWLGPVGNATTANPFSMTWTNLTPNRYTILAQARDNYGIMARSELVSFRVAPVNDDFANRLQLTGASVTTSGLNSGASKEPDEPNHADNSGGNSVWWTWTAPADGPVAISADSLCVESGYWYMTPLLAVYTGPAVASLETVASNTPDYGSRATVTFNAVAGVAYQIAVDGTGGNQDSFTLTLSQPSAQ